MSNTLQQSGRSAAITHATVVDGVPGEGVSFITGVRNVEDLLLVPNTKWVIGSGFTDPVHTQNYLHLFDSEKETGAAVQPSEIAIQPDTKSYPDCAPPDWKTFGPHGLGMGRTSGSHLTLYVVNHGGREAVEIFDVDLSQGRPQFAWTGCLVAPKGSWPDAVALLPDGGLVVTSMKDPTDPETNNKLLKGAPMGWIKEWHPGKGWTDIPGTEAFSSPNGVVVSSDGKYIFVNLSAGTQTARVTRGQIPPKVDYADTGGLPDNVRWSASGTSLLVGVHDVSSEEFVARSSASYAKPNAGGNVNIPFKILRLDPETLQFTEVIKSGVYGVMGGGTGAIEVGNKLWVSSFTADRIAIFSLK
jgi:DNA-binding beta-propeller fold protein YncE